jgi:hypothetical protein
MLHCIQQLGVSLTHNLVELRGPHPRVLHLLKRSAGIDALMLPCIPDYEHTILRLDLVEESSHLLRAGETRLVEQIEMSAGRVALDLALFASG